MAFTMDIAPYEGAFGVPLGSTAYDGGDNGFGDVPEDVPDNVVVDENNPNTDEGKYNDSEIVAIAEFQDIKGSDITAYGQEVKITVSCPNGMFFVSQSNSAFRFPFELQLIWTDQTGYEYDVYQRTRVSTGDEWIIWDEGEWSNWTKYRTEVRDSNVQNKQWYIDRNYNNFIKDTYPDVDLPFRSEAFQTIDELDSLAGNPNGSWNNAGTKYTETQESAIRVGFDSMDLWADIVLVLPGSVNTVNDTVTYNNVVYPLIEADDYTALVTITMEYGGQIKSITIPFSGFYEKGNTDKEESVCSLLVNPYSTAAHLSIAEDRGTWVPVGSLDFMLSTATNTNTTKPVIFASSSSNPEADTADEFRLVHESATFNTPLTRTNSIGFDVRIRNLNADGGTSSYIFDGTATLQSVTNKLNNGPSYGTDSGNNQYPLSEDWGGIVPAKIYSKLDHDIDEKSYYLYNGEIEVMMDPGTNVMLEGRYTGTVYIHVIANEVTTSG